MLFAFLALSAVSTSDDVALFCYSDAGSLNPCELVKYLGINSLNKNNMNNFNSKITSNTKVAAVLVSGDMADEASFDLAGLPSNLTVFMTSFDVSFTKLISTSSFTDDLAENSENPEKIHQMLDAQTSGSVFAAKINIKGQSSDRIRLFASFNCKLNFVSNSPRVKYFVASVTSFVSETVNLVAYYTVLAYESYSKVKGKLTSEHLYIIPDLLPLRPITRVEFSSDRWYFYTGTSTKSIEAEVLYKDVSGQFSFVINGGIFSSLGTIDFKLPDGVKNIKGINLSFLGYSFVNYFTNRIIAATSFSSNDANIQFTGDWSSVSISNSMNVAIDDNASVTYVGKPANLQVSQNAEEPKPINEDNDGLGGGAIAGIVIGVIALVACAGFLVYYFMFRNNANRSPSAMSV